MNTVCLIGNLTKDVELKETKNGGSMGIFTLAINRPGDKDSCDFIRIVTFGAVAEVAARFLKKGSKVGVTGSIRTGSYTKESGDKVYTTDVYANNITLI